MVRHMGASTMHAAAVLAETDPHSVGDEYVERGLDALSDAQLVGGCAAVIDTPKAAPPDSFVLHAPLELMARASLLSLVEPTARHPARLRLVWLAATYAAAGPAVPDPARSWFASPSAATASLRAAVAAGDLDGAERAASWLGGHAGVLDVAAALVDVVTPSLAGAAHGGIFLHQLLAFAASAGAPAVPGCRAFARELARHPDWQLSWFVDRSDHRPADGVGPVPTDALVEALRRPPSPGALENNFIYPTMHLTESSGLAADLLGTALAGVDRSAAATALLRVAALSMVQDDPAQAPYGWSHCLTMPQGLLAVARLANRPEDALALAATYVLGFRATLGTVALDPDWVPETVARAGDAVAALDGSPAQAAAAAWHAGADEQGPVVGELASYAAAHPDAHLAKYTLACLQQATADPAMAHLHLAAAAFLGAWWRRQPAATADGG